MPRADHCRDLAALFGGIPPLYRKGPEPAAFGEGPCRFLGTILYPRPQRIGDIILNARTAQCEGDPTATITTSQQRFGTRNGKCAVIDIAETCKSLDQRVHRRFGVALPAAFAQFAP